LDLGTGFQNGKMVFAKLKNFFAKLIFFPPKLFMLRKIFLFQNTKKSFGGKKINLAKKVGPFKISQNFRFWFQVHFVSLV
jgi:hypothetical protein